MHEERTGSAVSAVSPSAGDAPHCPDTSFGSGPFREECGARDGLKLSPRPADARIPFIRQDRQMWPGIVATLVHMKAPASYEFRFEGTGCCVALLDLYRTDGETKLEGSRLSHVKDMRDRLTFLPKGCNFSGWTRLARPGGGV